MWNYIAVVIHTLVHHWGQGAGEDRELCTTPGTAPSSTLLPSAETTNGATPEGVTPSRRGSRGYFQRVVRPKPAIMSAKPTTRFQFLIPGIGYCIWAR
ncbi:hypothetical protein ATL41_1624 [Flavimobilis soli]|uniref:Uncharacterized protein n=1 Tax=Flavimobilis soli TaxID=442709 RepID=A0A2A9EDJ6_9MICO|nr:hypothetical protein ATL41_1624 [Flavimobilis soli]